jgi:general L-amino acid transport system substrate-binding protein
LTAAAHIQGETMKKAFLAAALLLAGLVPATAQQAQSTLDQVRARGALACGVNTSAPGFTTLDSRGQYQGMVADLCRGLAAAIFGDATKVRFVPLSFATRFTALGAGEVDVLMLTSTHTLVRDATLGLRFTTNYFYDGHAFMARADANIRDLSGLAGATICLLQGTTNEQITAEAFRGRNLQFRPVLFSEQEQVVQALATGRCDAYGFDASGLASTRAALPRPADWVILNERFSKEPYTPVVRRGDEQWFDVVRWFTYALIEAEETGVTQANAAELRRTTQDTNMRRLLGATPELGQALRLDPAWALNAVRAIGNYGELYDRHFGPATPIAMPRAQNDLWTRGGLLYAPPFR